MSLPRIGSMRRAESPIPGARNSLGRVSSLRRSGLQISNSPRSSPRSSPKLTPRRLSHNVRIETNNPRMSMRALRTSPPSDSALQKDAKSSATNSRRRATERAHSLLSPGGGRYKPASPARRLSENTSSQFGKMSIGGNSASRRRRGLLGSHLVERGSSNSPKSNTNSRNNSPARSSFNVPSRLRTGSPSGWRSDSRKASPLKRASSPASFGRSARATLAVPGRSKRASSPAALKRSASPAASGRPGPLRTMSLGSRIIRKGQEMNGGKTQRMFSLSQFKYIIHQYESELKTGTDGTVTEDTLIEILMAFGMDHQTAFEEAHYFFEVNDVTSSGVVDVDEFCTEYVKRQNFKLINCIRKNFVHIDVDSSHSLEKEELIQVLMGDTDYNFTHHEAVDQVKMIFKEVDENGDGMLTIEELEDWYAAEALRARKKREQAILARRHFRIGQKCMQQVHKEKKGSPKDLMRQQTSHVSNLRLFTRSFYPVEDISEEQKARQLKHELDMMILDDFGNANTEIPVIISIFKRNYPEVRESFLYYSSLVYANTPAEANIIHMDQMKHMMKDAKLMVKSWDVEEEILTLKKRQVSLGEAGSFGVHGMNRAGFMEVLVRVAAMHSRTLSKAKLDTSDWLLEILQKHLRDKVLKPRWQEFQLRYRLKQEAVQKVYTKYMDKLWRVYNKYAMNVGIETKLVHPINTTGLFKLLKDCFPEVTFTKKDFVHWFMMSREEATGDGGARDRRSGKINGADVYWNEFLEVLARMALYHHPKSTIAIALEALLSKGKLK
mmetsp:Transcript_47802/g.79190  ORF Transcript_47802/g.79190 Transcript_47802/m.79190 type:complete len:781 (+) Transcript_47802:128-2470(+)